MTTTTETTELEQIEAPAVADWKQDLGLVESDNIEVEIEFDDPVEEEPLFQAVKPKTNPWVKIALVGGAIFAGLGSLVMGFLVVNSFMQGTSVADQDAQDLSQYRNDPQLENDEAELLEQLSDKKLDEQVFSVNQKNDEPSAPAQPTQSSRSVPPPPQRTSYNPPPRVQVPQVIYRDRPPTPQPQRSVAPKPQPKPVAKAPAPQVIYRDRPAPQPSPQPVAVTNSIPQPPVDPFQAWTQLTELGAFGGGDVVASNTTADYTVQNAVYGGATSDTIPVFDPGVAATENDYVGYTEDYSVGTPIAIGTVATGKLLTPIVWAEDLDPTGEQVLIELSNHLGEGVIPSGSLIVATIQSVSQSGAIALETDGAVVNGTERTLPSGALKITSSTGGYLIGKQRRQGDPFVSDFLGAALSGIGNSAGLLNRPRQTAQIGNGGIIQQVTTNNDENLVGGLVQGFTEEMASRTRTRLESRTNTRSPLFTVNQGTKVKLMVVQSANF